MGDVCWQVILPYHFKKEKKNSKKVDVDLHMIKKKYDRIKKKKSRTFI